ncbi:MAG TPA: carboxyl transferase domain-containing protein, partial [Pseudomonadales bacterium]|nr:carboxyl transferase domain-containing protein [Pseudomonadales bacterium]
APPYGYSVQLRINLESMHADGSARPAGGVISVYEPPGGAGIRVDGYGYTGYVTNPSFDSLLAKLILHSTQPDYKKLLQRAYRALCEFRLEGVTSNIHFLQNLLLHEAVQKNDITTRFIELHGAELLAPQIHAHPHFYFPHSPSASMQKSAEQEIPSGCIPLLAPVQGVVVSLDLAAGDRVAIGQQIAVLEAMKMEFEVKASASGIVRMVATAVGSNLFEGNPLYFIEPAEVEAAEEQETQQMDLDYIRPDLAEVIERHARGLDERRPEAVARRRKTGQRTTRENLADLLDADSFIEYGALNLAAQRKGKTHEELLKSSPADGLVAGIGTVNGALFDEQTARCMVLAYDYTVFAGTQGWMNHKKTDRMLTLAKQWALPLILFAEGGGGRPNDVDVVTVAMLDNMTFIGMAELSGLMPLVGVVSGRCFAGNAALLGCCDVIIATENATIGMAGPAMIEGGGLGKYSPEQVGPVSVQAPNGVIDILVKDEAEAVRVAKQYLSYFQGPLKEWSCVDQRRLRHLIPENRLRVYDIRQVIDTLADDSSVLELRKDFAPGMMTALIRIEGQSFGLMANNPQHLGGAIDAEAGDKAARFMQLCDAFDIPMISLCDTPGFMVGPEAEKTATVRHLSRMFVTAASLSVPFFTVVVRKGYGLGAQAMSAGSFHSAFFTIAWPSAEFGAMGIEGAVRLGFVKELEAIVDPEQRQQRFDALVQAAYQHGKGMNMASYHEIDDVIDPAETRRWLMRGLQSAPKPAPRAGKKRPFIDTW